MFLNTKDYLFVLFIYGTDVETFQNKVTHRIRTLNKPEDVENDIM